MPTSQKNRIMRLEQIRRDVEILDAEIKRVISEILTDDPTFDVTAVLAEVERERKNEQP